MAWEIGSGRNSRCSEGGGGGMARNKVFGGKVKGLLQRVMKLGARSAQLSLFPPLCCRVWRIVDWKRERGRRTDCCRVTVQKEEKRSRPTSYSPLCIVELHRGGDAEGFPFQVHFRGRGKKSRRGIGNWKEFPIRPSSSSSPLPTS